jgi:diacylglycerol kinase (ATP)
MSDGYHPSSSTDSKTGRVAEAGALDFIGLKLRQVSTKMGIPQSTGIRRIVNAFFFSLAGLRAAWTNEAAFRQECVLAIVMTPIGIWLGQDAIERALLIGSIVAVVIVELLNSAIETAVDRVGTDRHELSGRAKDLGSAAVFVSLVLVATIWMLIAWQRFG